jgi:murein DD-endopeptidase MepM/ murein hydrolase activator NlpD
MITSRKTINKIVFILFIILFLFACFASRKTESTETNILKFKILTLTKEKDSINYLLRILQKKDSISIIQSRHYPSLQPISSKDIHAITSRFGMKSDSIYKMKKFHDGIDFAADKGTPVVASADGIVDISEYNISYGNHVEIDHQNDYKTFYGHMNAINVINGQNVLRGDTIGTVGSTGISTGYHLHYKIIYKRKPVNPSLYIK